MAKTQRDLVNRVLSDLNEVGAGQDAEIEDFNDVNSRVDTIIAELNAREIINVSDTANIPDEFFEPLVEYVVLKVGPGYGRPMADVLSVSNVEDRLREVSRPRAARRLLSTDGVLRQGANWAGVRPNFRTGN
ncbi:MAG TPA: hypothetical protein VFB29_00415 [Pseudolabrys sp.]|nr:hypothetical protein [Pseudolabrys sp.]